jgi:hypothetical protein
MVANVGSGARPLEFQTGTGIPLSFLNSYVRREFRGFSFSGSDGRSFPIRGA